ncbi:MAG: N-acetylneuraminate synthase family protein [Anaerolineae bacterium]|nr:N-acetylneuraminate synthase family protein [Anaerolineae bacterium]
MSDLFLDLFIFEMANNHQGSVEHGLKIIRAMGKIVRKHNINAAVKFQYRSLEDLIHPDFITRDDVKHVPRFRSTRLTGSQFQVMANAVRDEGMLTMCTPFDEPSVSNIMDHGYDIVKVASCSATDWPLLETIAATRKPIICSTAGKSIDDIDNVYSFFEHRHVDFALMHCIGLYPTPAEELQLNFLDRMKQRYRHVPVGYSGHEAPDETDVVMMAVAKGADILERHVGVPTDEITLNKYSMNPDQVDAWVTAALKAKAICGNGNQPGRLGKRITQAELDSLDSLARGVYASRPIRKGEVLTRDSVYFAMPVSAENQTTSGTYQSAMIASRDYAPHAPICEQRALSPVATARHIIHDAKGMLYEARIEIGDDFEIELSHHYGLEHFRQYGALIVNLINREYCKKLIVMLSGQKHPNHRHKIKEETFQLLWGDLTAMLDGEEVHLKPGDKLLVERGAWHSFSTVNGAIFEEVSTTHIKGDSYYDDSRIASSDPMVRKTVLEDW